jgi:hypothetical protein
VVNMKCFFPGFVQYWSSFLLTFYFFVSSSSYSGGPIKSVEKTRVLEDCCSGYARTTDNSSCVPICGQQCLHGTW